MVLNSHPLTSVKRPNQEAGIIAIINNPWEWPQNSIFVAAGSRTSLALKPIVFSTSDDVANLDPDDRQCYYSVRNNVLWWFFVENDEIIFSQNEMDKYQLIHLPGLPYMRANCMSECRRVHMLKFCNCSVGFQFPIGNNCFMIQFS